ncbi:MAG: YkgJ family cysteine cluster protein [Bacteroidota bacterium]
MTDLIDDWRQRKEALKGPQQKYIRTQLRRKRGKALNQRAEELHEAVFSEINCLDCANCCTSIPPQLNRTDISRMAKHLGMKVAAFQEAYVRTDEDGDWVMNTSPCPFLQEDHSCLIYEYRPRACRQYPHTDQLAFSQYLHLHRQNIQHCPAVFHIIERMMKMG